MTTKTYDLGQAATELITYASKTRGDIIAAFGAYLSTALEHSFTVSDAIDQLIETEDYESIGSKATLSLYAQAIKSADSLGLSNATGYGITYSALSRIRRNKGYDLQATLAPITKLAQSARTKALATVGKPGSKYPTIVSSAKSANQSDKAKGEPKSETKAKSETKPKSALELLRLAETALKSELAKGDSRSLERVIEVLANLDSIVNNAL